MVGNPGPVRVRMCVSGFSALGPFPSPSPHPQKKKKKPPGPGTRDRPTRHWAAAARADGGETRTNSCHHPAECASERSSAPPPPVSALRLVFSKSLGERFFSLWSVVCCRRGFYPLRNVRFNPFTKSIACFRIRARPKKTCCFCEGFRFFLWSASIPTRMGGWYFV